ncbi:uncharacterized protein LOC143009163 [Genypterus blacodes]|uniref:uncharacterized protein LOC143009163 n=1 Tax=Genypterus blacodes TaxID=154954 RepID=UPI003F759E96
MSLQELPGSFAVMFPGFSLPMKAERSRNKERLEASLAGLCELELLKQRQEYRVLTALCLGDTPVPGRPAWGALRSARCALESPNGGASEDYGDGGLRLQTSSLQCTPWGIMATLEQQVAELKVNSVTDSSPDVVNGQTSSEVLVTKQDGSHESSYHLLPACYQPHAFSAPEGTVETETGETWFSDLKRRAEGKEAFGDMMIVDPNQEDYRQAQKVETYIVGLIQRRALPPRPTKPRTSLAHDSRAVGVTRQSSLCRKEDQHLPKQVSAHGMAELPTPTQVTEVHVPQVCHVLDQERYPGTGFMEDSPSPYHHLQQSAQHQPGHYHHKSRQPSMVNTGHSTSLDYASCRVLQPHPDSSNSEPDSPQHFHNYPSPPPLSKPQQQSIPDDQLVNAEYIPAQPCRASTRSYAHQHQHSSHKSSGATKASRSTYSPERGHHHQDQQPAASQVQHSRSRGGTKKCRSNDDKGGANRKPGKKACRSQSENSLQRVPERKYNTVERDGGGSGSGGGGSRSSQSRSKKQQSGSGGCRRWRSTLELSQDEADQPPVQASIPASSTSNQRDHCARRARKSRPTHTSYAYPHPHQSHSQHHVLHHQHMDYQLERDQMPLCQPNEDYPHPGQGESESSMSEADSPDSSSSSSDSDESGGLVWPQQLPPQLSLPSPPAPPGAPLQPKAFVKIKASHALKKKILRFRTGSLKVMTTV